MQINDFTHTQHETIKKGDIVKILNTHEIFIRLHQQYSTKKNFYQIWELYNKEEFTNKMKTRINNTVEFYKNKVDKEDWFIDFYKSGSIYLSLEHLSPEQRRQFKRRNSSVVNSFKNFTQSNNFKKMTTSIRKLAFQIIFKQNQNDQKKIKAEIKKRINYLIDFESKKKRLNCYKEIAEEHSEWLNNQDIEKGEECTNLIVNMMNNSIYHPLNGKFKDILRYWIRNLQIHAPVYEWLANSKLFNDNIDETICTVIDIKILKNNQKYYNIHFQSNNIWLSEILISKII